MEGDSDPPTVPGDSNFFKPNPSRPIKINPDSLSRPFYTTSTGNSTSSSSSSSSSPSKLVRGIQAAIKRRRPSGILQSNRLKPGRFPQDETPKDIRIQPCPASSTKMNEEIPQDHRMRSSFSQSKNIFSATEENHVDSTITTPSEWASTGNTRGEDFKPSDAQRDQPRVSTRLGSNNVASSRMVPGNVLAEVQKKVHFAEKCSAPSRGATETDRMATGMHDLLSDMDSLSLTDHMEFDAGYQANTSAAMNQEWQQSNLQSIEMNATTQSSIHGSSTAASTFINQASAPRITSTTYSSKSCLTDHMDTDPAKIADVQVGVSSHQSVTLQAITSIATLPVEVDISLGLSKEPQSILPRALVDSKHLPNEDYDPNKGNIAADVKSQPPPPKVPLSEPKVDISKSEKLERGVSAKTTSSRKKGYDPDLFFSVNGKLYQRLGKIGSGGSSEVHKVITSDCIIYALKKIKLRGRDYATAYGFCQEVVYLNKLKGKDNIIQLIDYEVTNKALLQQVMTGCMSNKDAIVKDDSYIYMVLEHGEIDLAHMLAQQWKKLEGSDTTIDENWLRFYWQQILLAVNTIHEERIVHSDLKPANFLLVKGSLKLIDFGIAKAIMNDTTNIQRDSQVGTLSYMSPEAFLCNETDTNGNIIKCGRPSDIWSLGCILYQMVYGRTPFSEYKTFWNKFKVITDPNHEIIYEPLSNPLLLDLMKKCLAWDRNERWRIPELLQHQFLAPPVSDKTCKLFQYIVERGNADEKTVMLCSQLENLVGQSSIPRDELLESLRKISTLSFKLQEQLANS